MLVHPLDTPEMNHKVEEAKEDDTATTYNITDQEVRVTAQREV